MKNEIKEITDYLKISNKNKFGFEQDKIISYKEAQILLDYITNLQEENERLSREKIQRELCESLLEECDAHNKHLQEVIDKAIKHIKGHTENIDRGRYYEDYVETYDLLNILNGGDEE